MDGRMPRWACGCSAAECRFLAGWKGDGHACSSGDDVTPALSLLLWWVPLSWWRPEAYPCRLTPAVSQESCLEPGWPASSRVDYGVSWLLPQRCLGPKPWAWEHGMLDGRGAPQTGPREVVVGSLGGSNTVACPKREAEETGWHQSHALCPGLRQEGRSSERPHGLPLGLGREGGGPADTPDPQGIRVCCFSYWCVVSRKPVQVRNLRPLVPAVLAECSSTNRGGQP